jgi:hypothetical protein
MKIRLHSESHIVELKDGPQRRIFPGDIDVTLGWAPETDVTPLKVDHEIGTRVPVSEIAPFASFPSAKAGLRGK